MMTVTLTCSCGRQLAVAAELAGRQCHCQACGNVVQVPAMGIAEGAGRSLRRARTWPARSFAIWPWLIVALVLVLGSGVAVILRGLGDSPEPDQQVRESATLPNRASEPLPTNTPPPVAAETGLASPQETREKPADRAKPVDLPVPTKPPEPKPPAVPPPEKVKPQPIPPRNAFGPPLRLEWNFRPGDKLFQDLRVVQKPTFNVQGISIVSSLQYRILSSFTVEKRDADKLVLRQKVESAEVLQADALTQGLLAPMVLKLPGTTFAIELNAQMEVTRFTGDVGKPQMAGLNLPGVQGLQMAGLLDADGWKEMAQLTFFQPNRGLAVGDKWTKPLTHNWGALGAWKGKAHFGYLGRKQALHQVDYALQLAYQAPNAGGLVANAVFRPIQAGGTIIFDADKGRVVEAQERFQVRGRISISLLGQNTLVDLEEDQLFFVRILDRDPRK